jgi:hypothetical protein
MMIPVLRCDSEIQDSSSELYYSPGSMFPQIREDYTSTKGQEFHVRVPKGDLTARVSKEDKNHSEIPRRKNLTLSSDRRRLQTVKDEVL